MKDGQYVFHIPSVANSIKIQAYELLNHLQGLKVCIFMLCQILISFGL